jgi:hypothetical protein
MLDIRGPNPPTIALILAAAFMWWGFANNSLASITVGGVFAGDRDWTTGPLSTLQIRQGSKQGENGRALDNLLDSDF